MLKFEGANFFRQRLVLATLSSKSVRIESIRSEDETQTGLTVYEASFLRLLEKLTNGCSIEISHTGTTVTYHPGTIIGGSIRHECPTERAVGYFLEPLIALAPFAKIPLDIVLTGITNDNVDVSVDLIRTLLLPQLRRFGVGDKVELKVTKRGAPPLGGGEVLFRCGNVRQLTPCLFVDKGHIKRIRGIAYATRISPLMANRVVDSCRSILTRYIPDVYIYTDVYKGPESGKSPGYALALVAESTTFARYSAECAHVRQSPVTPPQSPAVLDQQEEFELFKKGQTAKKPQSTSLCDDVLVDSYHFETPEELGETTALRLLNELQLGGTVDTVSQWLNLLFMALGPEDVSKVRFGSLSKFSVQYLRDLKTFLGVSFKITPDPHDNSLILAAMGVGYTNNNKKVA